jgi:uncharacterized protein (DUF697 family)
MRVFGREPVAILAFIAITLKLGSAYGWDLSNEQQTYIIAALACVVALVEALVLKTGAAFAAIVNLAQAALTLFLGFGLEMPAETQALWLFAVEAVAAFFLRRDVTAPIALLSIEQSSPLNAKPPVANA